MGTSYLARRLCNIMGRTLRLIACFVLVALMVSHEVQAMMTCWDRCVDACRDEEIGFSCVPQCFYGNCLHLPTGVAMPMFITQKNKIQQLEGQLTSESRKTSPDLMAYSEREYAYAPNPSSSEHSRKLMKNTD